MWPDLHPAENFTFLNSDACKKNPGRLVLFPATPREEGPEIHLGKTFLCDGHNPICIGNALSRFPHVKPGTARLQSY
jgi:hypothetical protein